MENVVLKAARPDELDQFYDLITRDDSWTKFNGPYFPYTTPTLAQFESGLFSSLCDGERALAITVNGVPVGSVSFYWECEPTRWLEAGIVIYDSKYWGQGLGYKALIPWITHLFSTLNIERVGLTTWSGNPRMMACAEKLGFKQEACIRKVRYHQGKYYDSIKYGVLRSEWEERN